MNQEKIGKFIQEKRKEKKMTQEQLAEKMGVSINAVSKWERGLCMMDISLLKPLSDILDISVSELLNGKKIEKIDNAIINDTITASTNLYVRNEKNKFIKKTLIILFTVIIVFFITLTIVSELNYGIVPLGSKAYVDFPNISSLNLKKQADKCMNLILKKDVDGLDKLVLSNKNYLLLEDASPNSIIDERLKKLSNDTHSKSYKNNLEEFYNNIEVKNYKYNFSYYDGRGYVFDYSLDIKHNNKDYVLDIQILSYKENVEFACFGFKNDDVEMYSDLYNLIFSVFNW